MLFNNRRRCSVAQARQSVFLAGAGATGAGVGVGAGLSGGLRGTSAEPLSPPPLLSALAEDSLEQHKVLMKSILHELQAYL